MALVNILSYTILDFAGKTKSLPLYFDAGATLAQMTAYSDDYAPDLDAAIDGQITGAEVTLSIALPGGLKSSPVSGNTVREGALLGFTADDTTYRHSEFVPTWENAGFSGNTVVTTGVYATLEGDTYAQIPPSTGIQQTDKDGNNLASYIEGKRTFRK